MRHLLRLDDWTTDDAEAVFGLARAYEQGSGPLLDGAAAMFFPPTSLRTRTSFERGAALAGLQPIVFPPESLDKDEAHDDVARYLADFVDVLVVRHPDLSVLEALAGADAVPVVNAMTSENHPCEVLADLWTLTRGHEVGSLRVRFVGADGNIARAWAEASRLFGFDLVQCCPDGLAAPDVRWTDDLTGAMADADVVVTDGPGRHAAALAPYRVTADVLALALAGVRFAPCPPFVRGREVSADALASPAFVGHDAKRALLPVQQAVLAHCLA
ncbi:ornithine carbamoyltransferase [Curtobacterium sp. TXMA1]|uniref:ornithine carbamoyltransferase n=1 Tax=Curtobacterium sp. TXMA1 TaxID=2876939 RepID=UPI001CCFEDA6|nr:ornithine carbamoyltransferase [Curtobacterium sp. TXMA1]UBQ01277.1 ornithine carbamoyltransferase [Curtobacterium sp. TXMA1]